MDCIHSILMSLMGPAQAFHRSVVSCEEHIHSLAREMGDLRSKRDDIRSQVEAKEREGLRITKEVNWWLDSVQKLDKEASAIDAQYDRRLRCVGDLSLNVMSTYQLSGKALSKKAEAVDLKARGNFRKLTDDLAPLRFTLLQSTDTVGMDSVLELLSRHATNEEVGIIGIHGMGGVGKTALLKRFNNEVLATTKDLDVGIWIEVSQHVDVEAIQKIIGDRLGLQRQESRTQEERADVLFKALSMMKFVLLLDDLWEPLDLKAVGIPIPGRRSRSKIIVASRIESVCDSMDADRIIKVECLPWEHAWILFQQKAGERISSDSGIRRYAEEIAKQCGGLPTALVTIGRAARGKKTLWEWKHAAATLKSTSWQIPGMKSDVLECLKLSYDNLSDDCLRAYLVHCAMYPDSLSKKKNEITRICFSEGVVEEFDDINDNYDQGFYFFGILEGHSLLTSAQDSSFFKMHPVVRLMVSWIGSECRPKESRWLVRSNAGLTKAPDAEEWRGAERISLADNKITTIPERPNCPALSTLFLGGNSGLEKIPDGFFQFMPCVRVLNLSHTAVKELPAGIGLLVAVEYLDLSSTKISSLPKELGALVKLKFLDLTYTSQLQSIPEGLLSSFPKLQVLYMYMSYMGWRVDSSGDEGVDVQELEGMNQLWAFGVSVRTVDAMKRIIGISQLEKTMTELYIRGCPGLTSVELPYSKAPGKNLKKLKWLRMYDCSDLEEVVLGCGVRSCTNCGLYPRPELLILEKLPKARMIWKGGDIAILTQLYIWTCDGIERLVDCKEEEEGKEGSKNFLIFPKLREMQLFNLPKFESLNAGKRALSFPCLEILHVKSCPNLKKLTLTAEKLKEVRCSKGWWSKLEWEDKSTEDAFQPLFKELQ